MHLTILRATIQLCQPLNPPPARPPYSRELLNECKLARRQLGSELHQLHPVLPLYDGVTGQAVPQHVDNRVERLRDALMDDARERVDDLGEDLVVGLAFA